MIAEYERAQIAERTRRGKAHRARAGTVNVLSGAPYGYRYIRRGDHADALYEIIEDEAATVAEVFRRYAHEGSTLADLTRWLTDSATTLTRTGKQRWDRSTVWAMLRNPAYAGRAAFAKTMRVEATAVLNRAACLAGRTTPNSPTVVRERPREEWIEIPVPPLVTEEVFALAQRRLADNARFAPRNSKVPYLLQSLVSCASCGYAYYRTSTRTTNKRISYYRCLGTDAWRYEHGKVCNNTPVRADYLENLVWNQVITLISDPALIQAELDRRLTQMRATDPAIAGRARLERAQAKTTTAITRLIEAYQEQLLTLTELRARVPALRARETAQRAQLDALAAGQIDRESYLTLAESLQGFLARLRDKATDADILERQKVVRLLVREVLIGPDKVTIRHSIPAGSPDPTPGYLLRGRSHQPVPPEYCPARNGRGRRGRLPDDRPSCRSHGRRQSRAGEIRRRCHRLVHQS
jgi:site-specific DNA recombinase